MKGMMDKGDTRAIGTRKKVGSMKWYHLILITLPKH
jgi:hypothetical protein